MLLRSLPVLLFASLLSAQGVSVVDDDGGPGVDFTDLQAAIDAAPLGTVILIKEGSYSQVTIFGATHLVAEAGAKVSVERVFVSNVHTGEVRISGLDLGYQFLAGVELVNNTAPIVLQDCTFTGGLGVIAVNGAPGALVHDSTAVTFEGCTFLGGVDQPLGGRPEAGLHAIGSIVALFDCELHGASGDPGMIFGVQAIDGAPGISASSSLIFCERTTALGGAGGDGAAVCQGAEGGPGAALFGSSELRILASTMTGGPGGSSNPPWAPGAQGADVDQGTGTVVMHPDPSISFTVEALLREQATANFAAEGTPGDMLIVGFSLVQTPSFVPGLPTPLLIPSPPPATWLQLGTVPASGSIALAVPLGDLPPGVEGVGLHAQLAGFTAQGFALGNERLMTFLDASL